ncbi:bacillithiol biosynthesis cysteine-adding enzyme BshC [Flagellimonas aequoris]|uniref:Putative cysteine ligase BshC n=1 Tax=Flagellimonas aequoris TaxID=2306997 RepID=A0A418NAI2_9FLAO|nr:bacillithiol biosynthesis cysteine-adding enzyme BshC [Allomuricauda aequoris]RIV72344.1 bacillithiol biosynthesis cysteine-adding enzyme BshC [Allomuricauda aequoris]TXK04369.1 bacillithiol biosynthesis cysteine-adding enzyme BshC [Allomuricauda aequoris]
MDIDCIPFKETGYFSKLICDYLDQHEDLRPFFNRYPKLENFAGQIQEKQTSFPKDHRKVLVDALQRQYQETTISEATSEHITRLADSKTFTVVTGHQLNLFTGPLYFLYKIVSTINLAKKLKDTYPDYHFVPVYWMATEDHDFDEINYFNLHGKKIQWNKKAKGAVGRLSTDGLDQVFDTFAAEVGQFGQSEALKKIFQQAYLQHNTLAEATRFLANTLFGEQGLVIVDGDDVQLKKLLVPYVRKDIFEQIPFTKVSESIAELSKVSSDYTIQVNPREINYFYLKDGLRERIVEKQGKYHVINTHIDFTPEALEKELENHPERFSPNVVTRPLYQEVILPNLCYIGGGGELAYWLELKSYFEALGVPYPMLMLRNSALVITEKQSQKVEKLGLKISHLFLKQHSLINKKIRDISNIDIDFSPQKKLLEEQFKHLYKLAEQTDESFLGAVKAQEVKQKKGLDALEKRLLKAQKRKLKDHVVRLTELQNELFPNKSLQERQWNFSELYLEMGDSFIPILFETLDPFCEKFIILKH